MSNFKQYLRWSAGTVVLAFALGLGVFGIATASRDTGLVSDHEAGWEYGEDHDFDDDDSEDHGKDSARTVFDGARPGNTVYREECGSCHLAYPPGLLPSASWKAIMSGLDDHFGENAELPADVAARLEEFLDRNASDRGDRLANVRLLRNVKEQAPLRISELPYFKREHNEIPQRMVEDNSKVGSFSNCSACHRDSERGQFDEDSVSIPGFGRWDD